MTEPTDADLIVIDGRISLLIDSLPIDTVAVRAENGAWVASVALESSSCAAGFTMPDTRSDGTPSSALVAVLGVALAWYAAQPGSAAALAGNLQVELAKLLDPAKASAIIRAAVDVVAQYRADPPGIRGDGDVLGVLTKVHALGAALDAAGCGP